MGIHPPQSHPGELASGGAPSDRPSTRSTIRPRAAYVFPSALTMAVREALQGSHPSLLQVADSTLAELLTVVFFASLETEEGERHGIRVALVAPGAGTLPPLERVGRPVPHFGSVRFSTPRAFVVSELTKLAVVTAGERMFVQVECNDGELMVVGILRAGFERDDEPVLKLVAHRAGSLSVSVGSHRILDYEGGEVVQTSERSVFAASPVRAALAACARSAGIDGDAIEEHRAIVQALAREMARHGRGGVLVVANTDRTELHARSPYRVAQLELAGLRDHRRALDAGAPSRVPSSADPLRGTLLGEAERAVREIAALSAIDGAMVLSADLVLLGFGVVLPVGECVVLEASDPEADLLQPFDLGSRGTRHRAAATFAHRHPGSVVFVASQDRRLGCMVRLPGWTQVVLFSGAWR